VPGGAFRIQIGSLASSEKASAEWNRLSARHRDLLGGLTAEIVRTDLGDRGIVFRLRSGPFGSKEQAQAVCRNLAGRGVNCIVVGPRG
jgi:cell division septation protein DedD